MSDFEIWTDGGCAPKNPGVGGYGIIIVDNATQEKREIKQGFKHSTNNRMELRAVIRALNEIPKGASVKLHTDSQYVAEHAKKNGWKRTNNHDLWELLDEAREGRDVAIDWMPRSGDKNNIRCDAMVHEAREGELIVDEGYIIKP